MPYIDNKALIEEARKQNPHMFGKLTDRQIYDYAVAKLDPEEISGIKGATYGPWEDEEATAVKYKPYKPIQRNEHTVDTTNPKTWMSAISDASLPGWLGDLTDWNFLKYSAMQGSTDLLKAATYGESNYQLKDENGDIISPEAYAEDLYWFQEILAWGLGQFNATDIGIWIGTAGVGKAMQVGGKVVTYQGAKGLAKGATTTKRLAPTGYGLDDVSNLTQKSREQIFGKSFKSWDRGITEATMSKGAFDKTKELYWKGVVRNAANHYRAKGNSYGRYIAEVIEQTPSSMVSLGAFSTATGTIHSLNSQRMSVRDEETGIGIGDISFSKAIEDGLISGVEGLALGAAIAPVSPLTTRLLGKMSTKLEKEGSPFKTKLGEMLKSPVTKMGADIGLEGTIFAVTPYAWRGLPKMEDGSIDTDQMLHDWAHSLGTIGMLKASFKAMPKIAEMWRGEVKSDREASIEYEGRSMTGELSRETFESMKKTFKDMGFSPAESAKLAREFTTSEFGKLLRDVDMESVEMKEEFLKRWDATKEIREKMEKGDTLTKDELSLLVTELAPYNRVLSEALFDVVRSPEALSNHVDIYYKNTYEATNGKGSWTPEVRKKYADQVKREVDSLVKELDGAANASRDNMHGNKGESSASTAAVERQRRKATQEEYSKVKQALKNFKKDDPRRIEAEKKIKEIEAKERDIDTFETQVKEVKDIVERKTPEERIESARDELLASMPEAYRNNPSAWQKIIDSKIVKDKNGKIDVEATAKKLEEFAETTKKANTKADPKTEKLNQDTKPFDEGKKLEVLTKGGQEKRIAKGKKTIDEHIDASNLSKENKSMAKAGFEMFKENFRNFSPGLYAKAVEFFVFLNKKGLKITEANTSLYDAFIRSKGLDPGSYTANTYRKVIAAFYGGRRGGAKKHGFSDRYMDGDIVAHTQVGAKPIEVEPPAAVIQSGAKGHSRFVSAMKNIKEAISGVAADTIQATIGLMYYFGRRGEETLRKMKVSDVDLQRGTVQLYSGKKKFETKIPLRDMHPDLWAKIEAIAKGRKPDEFLFLKKSGATISNDTIAGIVQKLIKDHNIDVKYFGGQKKYSAKQFRKTFENIIEAFEASGVPGAKRLGKLLSGRKMDTTEAHYISQNFNRLYKEFLEFRSKETKTTREERMTGRKGEVGPPMTRRQKKWVKKFIKKYYPELSLQLDKEILYDAKGKKITSDQVLETVFREMIKVKKGAPLEAALHGAFHPIFKVLRSIEKANPNTKLGKTAAGLVREMVRRAQSHKRFKHWMKEYNRQNKKAPQNEKMTSKEIRDRAIEETIVEIIGKHVEGRAPVGTFKAVKDWMHRTWTALKTVFKDVDKLSDAELESLLGTAFMKRKGVPHLVYERRVGDRMEFMTAKAGDTASYRKTIETEIKDFMNRFKISKKDYDAFVEYLASEISASEPGTIPMDTIRRFSIETAGESQLLSIHNLLSSPGKLNLNKMQSGASFTKRIKLLTDIKEYQMKTDLKESDVREYLIERGIESGSIHDASTTMLREVRNMLHEYRVDKKSIDKTSEDFDSFFASSETKKVLSNARWARLKHFASKNFLGLYHIAKHLKLDKLQKWVIRHITSEQGHVGPLLQFNDSVAPSIMGRKKWKKLKNVFSYLEANEKGEFTLLNDKTASAKEVRLAKEFIKEGFEITIDKNGNWHSKGIKWDPNTRKGTDVGEALYLFKYNLMRSYPKKMKNIMYTKYTKGKYEAIMKMNEIQFLNKTKEAFYIPRRVTRDFQNNADLSHVTTTKGFKDAVAKEARRLAKDIHEKKWDSLNKVEKEKLALEQYDKARNIKELELITRGMFGNDKVRFNHLISRNPIGLDATIDVGGKRIKVWETNFDGTVMPFGAGWGKFLANLEHAQWALGGLKGFKGDADFNALLENIALTLDIPGTKGKNLRNIFKKAIGRRVGSHSEGIVNSSIHDGLREYTSTLMRLQLGGPLPLSGIKNYFTQAIQMVHTFEFMDVLNTTFKAFSKAERDITEFKGATSSIGITGYKPTKAIFEKGTDWIFRTGLMPYSESVARTWARLAAQVDGRRQANVLKTGNPKTKEYKKAEKRLKEVYELTDYQLGVVKKHGFEPHYSRMTPKDATIIKNQMDGILNQIEIVGNMKTAGSTVDAMMPSFANVQGIKPLLMYKRIAYATTMNNLATAKYNLKNGHLMRTGMMIGGTMISGAMRIGILKMLLGQTLPGENSDWWRAWMNTLWQGEFLGIASEVFSPYAGSWVSLEGNMLFDSALTTHISKSVALMNNLAGNSTGLWETSKTSGEALKEWGRATTSSYNNIYKIMSQRANKYNREYMQIRKWKNDFEEKNGYLEHPNYTSSESKKYFYNARIAFNQGNEAEFNEAITLAFFAYASDRMGAGASYKQALKEAQSQVETRMKMLSPIIGSLNRKGYLITPAEGFLKSLDAKQRDVVFKAYAEYLKKIKKWKSQYPYYLRTKNIGEYTNMFDFKLDAKYEKVINERYLK